MINLKKYAGYVYLVLTLILWGSLYVSAKSVMSQMSPLAVLAGRYGISIIALYFIMRKRGFKKVKKEHRKILFAIGAVGYFGGIAFQLIGTDMIDASLASLINSMNPVIIPIIAAIFLKEKINARICISIAVSVIGIYVILGVGGNITAGGIIVNVLSVVFWSLSCCMVRSIANDYDPIQITLYAMTIAFCFSLPAAAINTIYVPIKLTLGGIASLIYIALVCTALSHILWNKSLKLLDATTCSLFYPIQPLTSAVLAIVFLGEKITLNFVIGAIIICAGIFLAVISTGDKPTSLKEVETDGLQY